MKFMVVVFALATIVFAEEPAPAKEKRGILGGLGYGSYSSLGHGGLDLGGLGLGHGGLDLGGLGLGHGVALTSAPLVSHASLAAPLSLGHGLGYGLGGLSLGGLSAAPLLAAPVVSKAYASPIFSKTIAPIGPIVTSPVVTKAIATPVFAKTIAAPAISYGHGLSLGYSGLGLGYH